MYMCGDRQDRYSWRYREPYIGDGWGGKAGKKSRKEAVIWSEISPVARRKGQLIIGSKGVELQSDGPEEYMCGKNATGRF